jgi:hypothetical protein
VTTDAGQPHTQGDAEGVPALIQTPRLWQDDGWTAKVVKSEEDDGWAVEMRLDGESEPALIAPWTMGRDKKNPKPLDAAAFYTWVKTANEIVRRHEQQLQALLHKRVRVVVEGETWEVSLDITPDDDAPTATLTATDAAGDEVARVSVSPAFKLTPQSASQWAANGWVNPMPMGD